MLHTQPYQMSLSWPHLSGYKSAHLYWFLDRCYLFLIQLTRSVWDNLSMLYSVLIQIVEAEDSTFSNYFSILWLLLLLLILLVTHVYHLSISSTVFQLFIHDLLTVLNTALFCSDISHELWGACYGLFLNQTDLFSVLDQSQQTESRWLNSGEDVVACLSRFLRCPESNLPPLEGLTRGRMLTRLRVGGWRVCLQNEFDNLACGKSSSL